MAPRRLPRLLLVTGMSGAGKSSVLDALEDMGWDVVDNLPADLLRDFVHGQGQCRTASVAVGMDSRSRGFDAHALPELIRSIDGVDPEILYVDSADNELIRRYDETRRRHPLAPDRPPEDGIARERGLTAPLRSAADSVLDTTDLSPAELRDELRRRYGGDSDQPVLTVASFAFARGISRTADLVFDLRFLPNPHWVDELRPLTGADQPVLDYLRRDPSWSETMGRVEALLIDWIPRYWAAGKSYVTVAFGCTGGRHRSVAAAVEMAERLRSAGFSPNVRHRDLASPPSDTIEADPRREAEAGE
jgi:RNase adapter protein RapZ